VTPYPSAISNAESLLVPQNNWSTNTVYAVGRTDTEILIGHATGLQAGNGLVSIDDEIISYTAIVVDGQYPLLVGCTRGFDDTDAKPHDRGALVEDRWVAKHNNVLLDAVRAIAGAIGMIPNQDPNSGTLYTSVVTRLADSLPLLLSFENLDSWFAVHNRRRVVAVHLFKSTEKGIVPFSAPVTQSVVLGGLSTVQATLDAATSGFMLLQ
jgi:hypothetical protein